MCVSKRSCEQVPCHSGHYKNVYMEKRSLPLHAWPRPYIVNSCESAHCIQPQLLWRPPARVPAAERAPNEIPGAFRASIWAGPDPRHRLVLQPSDGHQRICPGLILFDRAFGRWLCLYRQRHKPVQICSDEDERLLPLSAKLMMMELKWKPLS